MQLYFQVLKYLVIDVIMYNLIMKK